MQAAELAHHWLHDTWEDICFGSTLGTALLVRAMQVLGDQYVKAKDAQALRQLLTDLRPLFTALPKAKTAKLVRTIIDTIAKVPGSTQIQVRPPHCPAFGALLSPVEKQPDSTPQVCMRSRSHFSAHAVLSPPHAASQLVQSYRADCQAPGPVPA